MSDSDSEQAVTALPDTTEGRDNKGRFLPGHSGNPGGRPTMPAVLREKMQNLAETAVTVLEEASTLPNYAFEDNSFMFGVSWRF